MHPIEQFMLELGDLDECYHCGAILRLSQSGEVIVDQFHINNDLMRVKLLKKAGFLDYEIIPGHYGTEDGMHLTPTDKGKEAFRVYKDCDLYLLLAQRKYSHDDSFGQF